MNKKKKFVAIGASVAAATALTVGSAFAFFVDKDWTLKIDAFGTPILPSLTNPDCERIYKNYMRELERWLD